MRFTEWLLTQRHQAGPIGDLARDAFLDPTWPTDVHDPDTLTDYLEGIGSDDAMVEAAARAWSAWQNEALVG